MAKQTRTTQKTQSPKAADFAGFIGMRVWYEAITASGCAPVITTGTITEIEITRKGKLDIFVQPDYERDGEWMLMGKWRSEDHILALVDETIIENEEAVA